MVFIVSMPESAVAKLVNQYHGTNPANLTVVFGLVGFHAERILEKTIGGFLSDSVILTLRGCSSVETGSLQFLSPRALENFRPSNRRGSPRGFKNWIDPFSTLGHPLRVRITESERNQPIVFSSIRSA